MISLNANTAIRIGRRILKAGQQLHNNTTAGVILLLVRQNVCRNSNIAQLLLQCNSKHRRCQHPVTLVHVRSDQPLRYGLSGRHPASIHASQRQCTISASKYGNSASSHEPGARRTHQVNWRRRCRSYWKRYANIVILHSPRSEGIRVTEIQRI